MDIDDPERVDGDEKENITKMVEEIKFTLFNVFPKTKLFEQKSNK